MQHGVHHALVVSDAQGHGPGDALDGQIALDGCDIVELAETETVGLEGDERKTAGVKERLAEQHLVEKARTGTDRMDVDAGLDAAGLVLQVQVDGGVDLVETVALHAVADVVELKKGKGVVGIGLVHIDRRQGRSQRQTAGQRGKKLFHA